MGIIIGILIIIAIECLIWWVKKAPGDRGGRPFRNGPFGR